MMQKKKEIVLDDWENSLLIQIVCSENRAIGVTRQSLIFDSGIQGTYLAEARKRKNYIEKFVEDPLIRCLGNMHCMRTLTRFLRML